MSTAWRLKCGSFDGNAKKSRHRHHRLRHRRRDDRRRACRERRHHPDPRARRAAARQRPKRATPARFSSTAISGRRKCGAKPAARRSIPATTTMSAATRSSTARCCSATAGKISPSMEHFGGVSPAWPFSYEELEPWYSKAEQLFRVRGALGEDPTEPFHSQPYAISAGAGRGADRARPRRTEGPRPASGVAAARRRHRRLAGRGQDRLGCFPEHRPAARWMPRARRSPGTRGREHPAARPALIVEHLEASPDGKTIAAIHYRQSGEAKSAPPKLVILCAGAVNSAAILLRSRRTAARASPTRSDQVGRNFMNHNSAAMLAIDPRRRNNSVYQKTLMLNDYYLSDGKGGKPLGNVQLLGKINGNILQANVRLAPQIRARLHGRPCRRLVPDVRGPARSRKPHHGRRQGHRACSGGAPTCSRLKG